VKPSSNMQGPFHAKGSGGGASIYILRHVFATW
jgi:hypothetical protein